MTRGPSSGKKRPGVRRAYLGSTTIQPDAAFVAPASKPAVLPASKSAGRGRSAGTADLEIRDTADSEVCATGVLARYARHELALEKRLAFPALFAFARRASGPHGVDRAVRPVSAVRGLPQERSRDRRGLLHCVIVIYPCARQSGWQKNDRPNQNMYSMRRAHVSGLRTLEDGPFEPPRAWRRP